MKKPLLFLLLLFLGTLSGCFGQESLLDQKSVSASAGAVDAPAVA